MHLDSSVGQYLAKLLLTATVVVAISELAKRSTLWGAALASLPLTSVLAFIWLYLDTGRTAPVAQLAQSVLWLVLPSLLLFIALPPLLRSGLNFWLALALACLLTAAGYALLLWSLRRLGVGL